MRFRSRLMWISLVAAAVYAVSPAGAQPTGQGGQGKPGAGGGGAGGAGATGSLQLNAAPAIPAGQIGQEAAKHIMAMKSAGAQVQKMTNDSRAGRDVVKTLCLDDKLSKINTAIRTGEGEKTAVTDALGRKDIEAAQFKLTVLAVLKQRVDQTVGEAGSCIGAEAAFAGNSTVTVNVSGDIPGGEEQGNYPTTDVAAASQPPTWASGQL